ncbi:TPA: hypothetical protein ACTZ34_005143 [Bacillus cereus]
MFWFELLKYFNKYKVRIVIVCLLLGVTCIYSKHNVSELLTLMNLLPNGTGLTAHDYLIGMFNSAQFIMFFVFPVLFSILIADIINADFDDGYINLVLPRINNRFNYIWTKCNIVFFVAILFTSIIILLGMTISVIFKLPFSDENHHFLFTMSNNPSVLMTYISTIFTFICGLTFIGMLTLVIAMYTQSSAVAIGSIIVLSFVHNAFYVGSSNLLIWLPFSQYIVGLHSHFVPFGIPVRYFTVMFSNIYILIGILLMLILLTKKINTMENGR